MSDGIAGYLCKPTVLHIAIYHKSTRFDKSHSNGNHNFGKKFCRRLQSGGPDGELGASMRYLSQRYSMPYPQVQALLTDIGTEGSELHSPPAANPRFTGAVRRAFPDGPG